MTSQTKTFSIITAILLSCGSATMIGPGCSAEDQDPNPVSLKVGAAFTTLRSADIYDRDGNLLIRLNGENPIHDSGLAPGDYYLDLRDQRGNGVYDDAEHLLFVPKVHGAALDLSPHRIADLDHPVVRISVGASNGTMSPDNQPEDFTPSGKSPTDATSVHATRDNSAENLSRIRQAVTNGNEAGMRARVVWEAARAMVGPNAASYHHWPETSTNSHYRYASEDRGAWNAVRRNYGFYQSCRDDSDQWNRYYPCLITYGTDDPYQYEVQNGWYKGGQCKGFSNLVIYRSGVHHGANWSMRTLPPDSAINSSLPNTVRAKPGTLQAGDVLRMPFGHSAIVVRVIDSHRAVVFDSNWIGGEGWENIGTHVMDFSGSGVRNLGNYYRLNCVYSGYC